MNIFSVGRYGLFKKKYRRIGQRRFYDLSSTIPNNYLEMTFKYCIDKNPLIRGLIFETEGKSIGFTLLTFTYSNELGGLCLWVDEIYIIPEFQNKGYFRNIMEFLDCEYKNIVKVYCLEVHKYNSHAIEVYKHLGFQESDNIFMNKYF